MVVNRERDQWLLLLGAMLGSKQVREDAAKRLAIEDVPEELKPLWLGLKGENAEAIKGAMETFGIAKNGAKVIDSLVKTIQERSLDVYCKAAIDKARMSGLLTPDQIATFLEKMAVNIRSKQEALK